MELEASKLWDMWNEVGKYIDTLIEDIQIHTLEVEGQILSLHMKRMIEIKKLEKMVDDAIIVFVVNPIKVIARLHESMFYLDYTMRQTIDMSMDLEVKHEGLCLMRCTKISDQMK